jgi:hypothetical protein
MTNRTPPEPSQAIRFDNRKPACDQVEADLIDAFVTAERPFEPDDWWIPDCWEPPS